MGQRLGTPISGNLINCTGYAGDTAAIAANTAAIATNTASIAAHESAWTAYTPTVSAAIGSLTAYTASGAYKQIGKTVFIRATVVTTTNGTGASYIIASLPFTPVSSAQVMTGRETLLNGSALSVYIPSSTAVMWITYYNNTYPGANGNVLIVSGVYEAA